MVLRALELTFVFSISISRHLSIRQVSFRPRRNEARVRIIGWISMSAHSRIVRFHRPLATRGFGHWLFSSGSVVMRDERIGNSPFLSGLLRRLLFLWERVPNRSDPFLLVHPGLRGMPPDQCSLSLGSRDARPMCWRAQTSMEN